MSSFSPDPNGDPSGAAPDSQAPDPKAPVRDAVFEDIELDAAPSGWEVEPPADTQGEAIPTVDVAESFTDDAGRDGQVGPVPEFTSPEEPYVQEPSLHYDEASGFRIDYGSEGAPEPSTTALARIERPQPVTAAPPTAPSVPAPPAPPVPPRAAGRYAARDKARMLRRHKWLILSLLVLGLLGGLLASLLVSKRYDAYSVLLISSPAQDSGGLNSGFVTAPGEDESRTLNQALILQEAGDISRETAETLLARTDVSGLSVYRDAEQRFGNVTTETLAQHLKTEVVQVTPAGERVDAIRVQASAETGVEAADIARIYTNEYLDLSQSTNRERLTATREILEEQLARREGELSEIEQQLKRYMTARNAAGLEAQTSTAVSQIGSLQSQLDAARAEVQQRSAQLAQLQADLSTVRGRLQ
ncbi:MAG: Wzz/FepE/Etk N-terminal domain-containing protein, partial [Bacteroidota bacterium]